MPTMKMVDLMENMKRYVFFCLKMTRPLGTGQRHVAYVSLLTKGKTQCLYAYTEQRKIFSPFLSISFSEYSSCYQHITVNVLEVAQMLILVLLATER